jgi:ADP-ribose pyrophosphatase YjhB (NUDIX family)
MARPIVIVAPDPEIARVLGVDFRWPVVEATAATILVSQGFSVICAEHPGESLEAEIVALEDELEVGAAHQRIAAAGLDPLKLNADMGTFGWTSDGAGRVLMVRVDYGPKHWMLPGGTLDIGEAPDKAVAREVKEETGYDVEVERLIAVYGRRQHIGLYFGCIVTGGSPRTEFDTEVAEVGWFDPEDPPQPTSPVIALLRHDMQSGHAAHRFF